MSANLVTAADSDVLILVDEQDRGVGHLNKTLCHAGRGVLHRAFSLLIFNPRGELLIQRRAASKRLWPLYWSNSCCSHPRGHETMAAATQRRLLEELGLSCPLVFLYKFQYRAQFDADGAEHELCSVFIGRAQGEPRIDTAEICDWRWIGADALTAEMSAAGADAFTPWFVLEWARVRRDHDTAVRALR